jgi:hypothetical protein
MNTNPPFRSFAADAFPCVKAVTMIGASDLKWTQDIQRLHVTLPSPPTPPATTLPQ